MEILVIEKYNVIFYKDSKHFLGAIDYNNSQCVFINAAISYGGKAPKIGYHTDFNKELDINIVLKGTIVSSLSTSDLWFLFRGQVKLRSQR